MKASVYKKSTDEELNEINKQYTKKYGNYIKSALLNKENILNKDILFKMKADKVNEFVFEWLFRNLTELAMIMFNTMKALNNFGAYDEDTVTISFCRSILNIPSNRVVNLFDITMLKKKLDECHKKHGRMSADEYTAYLQNYSLTVLGMKYPQTNFTYINNLLELLNADFYFYNTYSDLCGSRFILSKLEKFIIEQNEIYLVQKEYIRSPHFILVITAEIFRGSSIIRLASCETIFFNWLNHYNNQHIMNNNVSSWHPNTLISQGIKKQALLHYGAFNSKDVLKIKDTFIHEMLYTIFWHECGHHISYKGMDPIHKALHHNFIENGSVLHVLHEALADWAQDGDNKGFFSWLLDISHTDINCATRQVYVYMSDNFFDAYDGYKHMSLMSNILVGLAISFINNDGTINFNKLSNEKAQIYNFFQTAYKNIMDKLLDIIQNAEYDTGIITLDYYSIENELYEMYQQSRNARSVEELHLLSFFWTNVIHYLQKYSKDGWVKYQNVLNEGAASLELSILNYISKGNEERYQYSIKNFIIEKSIDVGIIDTTILSRIPAKEENYDYMHGSGLIKRTAHVFESSKKYLS